MAADQLLFTYGTLQQSEVQLDTFGRMPLAEADALPGYRVSYAEIDDPRVVEVSGLAVHPIVTATGDPRDKVTGSVLLISDDELEAADEYEVALYVRTAAVLSSGRTAWVYVSVR
ncbi:gamma-glutamylcyclotransferase family protein [Microbacterium sp. P02]|uniref:gamma-glutamylcyclotransferase family protein n=1 Tax=Microbacterium sp. P02 TaxID=3366260 RepID=UPI003673109B